MNALLFYVSGHGFGHATRTAEVIRAINTLSPDTRVYLRASAPADIFRESGCIAEYMPGRVDVGVRQSDSLTLDIPGTRDENLRLLENIHILEADELSRFGDENIRAVVSDIPPFAFRISRRLNVPGIGIANFSWDWIYETWFSDDPEGGKILDFIRDAYRRCHHLLRLPFSPQMEVFPSIEDIPLIARTATVPPETVRNILGLPDKPVILLSFGGMGLNAAVRPPEEATQRYCFISIGGDLGFGMTIGRDILARHRLKYPDIVSLADIVVTKPGYGIVSECVANRSRILYTDRGPFREYDLLVSRMKEVLPVKHVPRAQFFSGRWSDALDSLIEQPFPEVSMPSNGAETAARRILEYAGLA